MKKWFPILITIMALLFGANCFAEGTQQVIITMETTENGTVDLDSPSVLAAEYIDRILQKLQLRA